MLNCFLQLFFSYCHCNDSRGVIALLSTSGFLYYVMHDGVGLFKNQLIYFRGVVCFCFDLSVLSFIERTSITRLL